MSSVFVPVVGKGAFQWICDSLEAAKALAATFPARTAAKVVYAFEGDIIQKYDCTTAKVQEHEAEPAKVRWTFKPTQQGTCPKCGAENTDLDDKGLCIVDSKKAHKRAKRAK